MTDTPRNRVRTRNATARTTTKTEARTGAVPTSSAQVEAQKPAKRVELVQDATHGLVALITIRDGVTLNMTDYNSFRRDVELQMPVVLGDLEDTLDIGGRMELDVGDKLDKAYDAVQGWLDKHTAQIVEDAKEYFEV